MPYLCFFFVLVFGLAHADTKNAEPPSSRHELSDAKAQYELGQKYAKGAGVERDDARACALFKQSAEQGFAPGQYALGYAYFWGLGVKGERAQSLIWFSRAAEQEDARAQLALGRIFATGTGVKKDPTQAALWYEKAADQGLADAQVSYGYFLMKSDEDRYEAKALTLFQRAAQQGHSDAQYMLGQAYAYGWGLPEDVKQGMVWLEKSGQQGHAGAMLTLAKLYLDGKTPEQNVDVQLEKATALLRQAATLGHPVAQRKYAHLLLVQYRIDEAYTWMKNAAANGDKDAEMYLLDGFVRFSD